MVRESGDKPLPEEDRIEVAIMDRAVYLKPLGFATQHNSLGIPDFVRAMFRAGCNSVAIDLAECKGMDSTFLGVIADAAIGAPHRPGRTVVVLNAHEAFIRQLQCIGLLPMICLHRERVEPPAQIQLCQIDSIEFPKSGYQRLQKVKHLHEQLAGLNKKNRRLFGPFVAMLQEELQLERERNRRE